MMYNGQQLDPALIQAMLEAAGDEGETENIDEQTALANALRGKAMGNQARTGFGVLAQGLQGYVGGREAGAAKEARGQLGQKQTARRTKFFEAMFPGRPGYTGEVPGENDTWGYGD